MVTRSVAIAHLRIRDEGAAGTLDRAVTIVLDIVPGGRRAIRTDQARAGPDDTSVLVIDQLTDEFPRLLQLAGEAGDLPDDLLQRLAGQAVGAEAKGDRPALDALHAVQSLTRHSPPHRSPRPGVAPCAPRACAPVYAGRAMPRHGSGRRRAGSRIPCNPCRSSWEFPP